MSAPSIHLPSVTLPDLPDVSNVTDRAGDVWSTGFDRAHDLTAAAIDLASDLASAAVDRFEDLDIPDKAIGLAGAVIPALRPTPKRSKKPFVLIAVVLVVIAGGIWFKRRRASGDGGSAAYPAPLSNSEQAVSAAS
jgi:hypothetical protein